MEAHTVVGENGDVVWRIEAYVFPLSLVGVCDFFRPFNTEGDDDEGEVVVVRLLLGFVVEAEDSDERDDDGEDCDKDTAVDDGDEDNDDDSTDETDSADSVVAGDDAGTDGTDKHATAQRWLSDSSSAKERSTALCSLAVDFDWITTKQVWDWRPQQKPVAVCRVYVWRIVLSV